MSWNEIFQIISGVIISVGGAGFVIWKLSSYFGEIWAKKHLESIKKKYQKEIEAYKTKLDTIKETTLRYSGKQFELYNKLWKSLCRLKSTADMLWREANEQNLRIFSQQLKKTMEEVEKSFLFIEDSHYKELSKLFEEFKNYSIGKKKLIELYMSKRSEQQKIDHDEILKLIKNNRRRKQRYDKLVKKIGNNLKKQLKGK